jgi:hypothetical protein
MTTVAVRPNRFAGFVRRHAKALLIACALLLISTVVLLSFATRLSPSVRDKAVSALNSRFQSEVDMDWLQVSVFPRPEVTGGGLRLRHNGRTDVPPLITIGAYSASAGLFGLFSTPLRLRTVELDRLEIRIPPGGLKGVSGGKGGAPLGLAPVGGGTARVMIDQIVAREARLEIISRDKGKLPRVFDIHNLVMGGLGHGDGSPFHAVLTNPTPRGEITTQGNFGPWQKNEPRTTPVRGTYVFNDANLDTIKGIGGILSSTGAYSGVLERIEVKGQTDTPDFSIDIAKQPVPLKTRFHAIVDGTNGDTFLEEVEARLLQTVILAKGAVVRAEDVKGRKTTLDVKIENGRIEDVLKLAVKSKTTPMTGRMQLETAFLLPAGDRDVVEKLQLDGAFRLERARFTSVNVQKQINELSRRGRGDLDNEPSSVVSNLSGRFLLRRGTLRFSSLTFGVPGAVVQLAGTFDLQRETLDFKGNLLLDASLAETTTGFKSLLARIAQPLFRRKGGGSKLPIRIEGPLAKPKFGLDVKRALTPGD